MSAVTEISRDLGLDGIRRYRTKVKVRIDSHERETPLWISDDVVAVSTGKTVKGAGQANLMVLPRVNYLNLINPNDYVNVYFNIGDGEGWTRTFFGFVDRIEESYQVSSDGKPTTQYNILCTDFYKVFDKTNIYFNPHVAGRSDISGEFFGTPNIGGLALQTAGLRVHGSPADIVVNLLLVLLGFGTQFSLPPSYVPRFKSALRKRRSQFIQNRLESTARKAIADAGSFNNLQDQVNLESSRIARNLVGRGGGTTRSQIENLLKKHGISGIAEKDRIIESALAGDVDKVASFLADDRLQSLITLADPGRVMDEDRGTLDILQSSVPSAAVSILDVIDIFSFVERTAIDGFHEGRAIWQKQGPLISIIRSVSHELVNELIFDLRPFVNSRSGQGTVAEYSRESDEIEGNLDTDGGRPGIQYLPSMVLREYPYSTIDGIDLRGVTITVGENEGEVGIVYFGDIFADRVGQPGRHAIQIPNIHVAERQRGGLAPKSLDVAVVYEEEIVKTQFGRSDHEHFNLFEFYTDALNKTEQRFYMHDFLPIVTPIHIMRHGLRVRSVTTKFARFSLAVSDRATSTSPTETEEEKTASEEAVAADTVAEEGPLPVVVPGPDTLTVPISSVVGMRQNAKSTQWAYHALPRSAPVRWKFHHGTDIVTSSALRVIPSGVNQTAHISSIIASEIPVYAIADGEVVVSSPGVKNTNFGQVVVIRHDFDGQVLYSTYAHLSKREVGPDLEARPGTTLNRARYYANGFANGRSTSFPIRVRKGTIIGRLGNTGSAHNTWPHLHFELGRVFSPQSNRVTAPDGTPGTPVILIADSPSRPSAPEGFTRSLDPIKFFEDHGVDFAGNINGTSSPEVVDEDDEEDFTSSDEDAERPRDEVIKEAGRTAERIPGRTSSRNNLDNVLIRQQIVRWSLLHDHWYQHNLEYLSGTIEMRGAPEIRVGYRLDLPDRNLSFYVDAVNHQYRFPEKMTTVLQVVRGQSNNPFPMYVLPALDTFEATATQRRTSTGRLSKYFAVPDPLAVRRALILRGATFRRTSEPRSAGETTGQNSIDTREAAETYNESVVLPASARVRYPGSSGEEGQVRVSGDLRRELEQLQEENRMREILDQVDPENLEESDALGDFPTNDFSLEEHTAETDSGVTGMDTGAPLESDIFEV